MTKYIQEPDMDIWRDVIPGEELDVDPYARYGGLRPGMIPGAGTDLPIPAPTPAPILSRRERIDRAKPALAWIGGVLLVVGVGVLIIAFVKGWLA